jgi:predicted RNA methylase
MASGQSITGRKKNIKYDLYETPKEATRKILDALIDDSILNTINDELYECCSGAGAITNVLDEYGFKYNASDIQIEDYIVGEKGIDVYELPDKCCDIVFTNPPYNLMTPRKKNFDTHMLKQFLRISKDKVILLLNIFYLSSDTRMEMLKQSPLKYVYMHSDRVTMFPYGEEKPDNGGTKFFAWYVFEHGYTGEPVIRWL